MERLQRCLEMLTKSNKARTRNAVLHARSLPSMLPRSPPCARMDYRRHGGSAASHVPGTLGDCCPRPHQRASGPATLVRRAKPLTLPGRTRVVALGRDRPRAQELKEAMQQEPDPEYKQAVEENSGWPLE
jgi:hypothetical protein